MAENPLFPEFENREDLNAHLADQKKRLIEALDWLKANDDPMAEKTMAVFDEIMTEDAKALLTLTRENNQLRQALKLAKDAIALFNTMMADAKAEKQDKQARDATDHLGNRKSTFSDELRADL